MLNNRIIIVIALITSLLLGVVFVMFILRNLLTPTAPNENSNVLPTRFPQQDLGNAGIRYDERGTDTLLRIVTERPTPPPSDASIRTSLINSVNNSTGTLYENDEIKIEYVRTPNDFEVEIKTMDISRGKDLALSWYRSQGLSDTGICSLPTFFYLNYSVLESLRGTNYTFNPLPDFCE